MRSVARPLQPISSPDIQRLYRLSSASSGPRSADGYLYFLAAYSSSFLFASNGLRELVVVDLTGRADSRRPLVYLAAATATTIDISAPRVPASCTPVVDARCRRA